MDSSQDPEDLITTWKSWIDRLRQDLNYVYHHREMWTAVIEAIQTRAPESPATWMSHYTLLYVDGQAMAIRRLIQASGQHSISLGRLMESIERAPDLVSRDAYVQRSPAAYQDEHWVSLAREEYDSKWGDDSGKLDVAKVRRDRSDINTVAKDVIALADTYVAHITTHARPAVTFGDLDHAINHTGEVFQHYAGLVTYGSYVLTPAVPEWQSTFYGPLFDQPPWDIGPSPSGRRKH
jgi:AbiU2